MNETEKIAITTFTDPTMGLSYECEPIFRKLETRFAGRIKFKYVMAGLVRDISDFMSPCELKLPEKEGIKAYNERLAKIYLSEEHIGGMPIAMDGFRLFDAEHRSSYPLNIAYKAAQLADPKAELFLYLLRYATVAETRQTKLESEMISVAKAAGIDAQNFIARYRDGSAKEAFMRDLRYTRGLGIYSLPAYLIEYAGKSALIKRLIGYDAFANEIRKISDARILPAEILDKALALGRLLDARPLISFVEIKEALDLDTEGEALKYARPFLKEMGLAEIYVKGVGFLKRGDFRV